MYYNLIKFSFKIFNEIFGSKKKVKRKYSSQLKTQRFLFDFDMVLGWCKFVLEMYQYFKMIKKQLKQ